ncbi:hypothetical protein USB125703_01410 [Pseudoclavibacter triregionum]|nr:hypothetical protein USB125703_01410 [Pseudoclavibacter triregionum]
MDVERRVIRPPAVAGAFYPADPAVLAAEVDARLEAVRDLELDALVGAKAVISPHAGHRYSGLIAARAIDVLEPSVVRRVVLLGPIHHVPFEGMALPAADAFATPLGEIPVDAELVAAVAGMPGVAADAAPHAPEHSLEVILPFLQRRLGEFTLLPIAVGPTPPEQMADVLERVWGGPETAVVVSSDLSHYEDEPTAHAIDGDTVRRIRRLAFPLPPRSACGRFPVDGLLALARRRGLRPEPIGYATSADAPEIGDPRRVVGYAAVAFLEAADAGAVREPVAPQLDGAPLTALARRAIEAELGVPAGSTGPSRAGAAGEVGTASEPAPTDPALERSGAAFVTLTIGGQLRGCIGSLEPRRSLGVDVRENAVRAATGDPRFPPLSPAELARTRISVSVLGELAPFPVESEEDAIRRLVPGEDGVLLEFGPRRGTFLPSVWEQLPDARDFLRHLKRKAGLPEDWWDDRLVLSRYRVAEFEEPAPDAATSQGDLR